MYFADYTGPVTLGEGWMLFWEGKQSGASAKRKPHRLS